MFVLVRRRNLTELDIVTLMPPPPQERKRKEKKGKVDYFFVCAKEGRVPLEKRLLSSH